MSDLAPILIQVRSLYVYCSFYEFNGIYVALIGDRSNLYSVFIVLTIIPFSFLVYIMMCICCSAVYAIRECGLSLSRCGCRQISPQAAS